MSYCANDYPSLAACRRALREGRDLDPTICPNCGADHPASFRLSGCAQPGCEVVGCYMCLVPCEVATHEGRFCSQHVDDTDLEGALAKTIKCCLRCLSEDLDESEAA